MSLQEEKAKLEASQARLEASRIDPKSFVQKLEDIPGLFVVYEEMKKHGGGREVEGTMETVLGLTEDGSREIFQVLREEDGEICYVGNISHPCPPYTDCN